MNMHMEAQTMLDPLAIAQQTLDIEIAALKAMRQRLDHRINQAVEMVLEMRGRVVVVGMGKSGIIGQKIAATLASTGTPAFFVHPGEAFHGDLGMIKPIDVALLISNSGETEEVLRILPFLQYQKNKIIAMTGKMQSTLAQHADVVLDVGVEREACKNNLAPTSSTTNTLAMGDALAVALTVRRNFQPEDFARFHPGGSLGRLLLAKVADYMVDNAIPCCDANAKIYEIIEKMTAGRVGAVVVMEKDSVLGIITDGDLRRSMRVHKFDNLTAEIMMKKNPIKINLNEKIKDAKKIMIENKISILIVVDAAEKVVGLLDIYGIDGIEND